MQRFDYGKPLRNMPHPIVFLELILGRHNIYLIPTFICTCEYVCAHVNERSCINIHVRQNLPHKYSCQTTFTKYILYTLYQYSRESMGDDDGVVVVVMQQLPLLRRMCLS